MNLMTSNETKTMTSREIAELTGKDHKNILRDIRNLLLELYGDEGLLSFEHTYTNEQNQQTYRMFRLPKRECLILVSGYSVAMRAKIIDRWQELEQQVSIKQDIQPVFLTKGVEAAGELNFLDAVNKSLNLAPSAYLGAVKRIAVKYEQTVALSVIPTYAIDAAPDSKKESSDPTFSATRLLKDRKLEISAMRFNEQAENAGILVKLSRNSSSSSKGVKYFWAFTQDGLKYGKNVTIPTSQLETQPHWYASKFDDALRVILNNNLNGLIK
jgi:Rha family phage regulatory protein